MTIPEACRLVMEAATISSGNQIFCCSTWGERQNRQPGPPDDRTGGAGAERISGSPTPVCGPAKSCSEEVAYSNTENALPHFARPHSYRKVREYDYEHACEVVDELDKLSRIVEIPEMGAAPNAPFRVPVEELRFEEFVPRMKP